MGQPITKIHLLDETKHPPSPENTILGGDAFSELQYLQRNSSMSSDSHPTIQKERRGHSDGEIKVKDAPLQILSPHTTRNHG